MNKETMRPMVFSLLLGAGAFAATLLPLGVVAAAAALCCALVIYKPNPGGFALGIYAALALLLGGLAGLPTAAGVLVMALLLYAAMRQFAAFSAALFAAGAVLLGLFAYVTLSVALLDFNPVAFVYEALMEAVNQVPTLYAALFEELGTETMEAAISTARAFYTAMFREEMGAWLVLLGFAVGLPLMLLVRRICKKHLPVRQPFAFFTVPRMFGTATLVCYVVFWLMSMQIEQLLSVSLAMQMLFVSLFALQGLAVVIFLLQRRKVSRGGVGVLTALMVLLILQLGMARMMLAMLGAFETFMQLRLRLHDDGQGTKGE